ncbi:hypothetical protein HMI55_005020 [Coelomomyces lativittatus]|nr:hypothetical protein HMI55_005020 [Coelomomyces lativittatus]
MQRLFGTAKPQAKPSLTNVISTTDERADVIETKIKKLDIELTKYKGQLSKLRDGPGKEALKQRAMRVLKQKKQYESQYEQLRQQSFNLEQTAMTTENLKNTMVAVDAMKEANNQIKQQYKKINLDKIEKIQDELEDLMYQANEVQELMGRSYGVPDDVNEEDLEAELEALGDTLLQEENEEVPSYLQELDLPSLDLPTTTGLKDPLSNPTPASELVPANLSETAQKN